jgi:hypothetical protein
MEWCVIVPSVMVLLIFIGVGLRLAERAGAGECLGEVTDGIPPATSRQGPPGEVYTYEDYAIELGCNPYSLRDGDGKPVFRRKK